MNAPLKVDAKFPHAFAFLFEPARYKVVYGGRGKGASWSIARALLIRGAESPKRVLCAREFQSSIRDSVHRLLADQVHALHLDNFYEVQQASIRGINGTEFAFEGLRHNANKIKSYEGIDLCWVEEAENVSRSSWEILIPTIRKAGSEIWLSFNTQLETDETYQRFVVEPPPDALVRKINWRDNPWFPDVLRQEMQYLKAKDHDAYLNIWEGHPRVALQGAIYAKELRDALSEGRICKVPYDPAVPVNTFWDLGFADHTSIIFAQKIGFEYHVIDAYQSRLEKFPHYMKTLQDRGYVYGTHYMPHDADHEMLAATSLKKQMEAVGHRVVVLPRVEKKEHGINAARNVFNRLYFDQVKCADLIQALRHYRYDIDEQGQWSKVPLHDDNSHYADALQALGQAIAQPERKQKQAVEVVQFSHEAESVAWLGS